MKIVVKQKAQINKNSNNTIKANNTNILLSTRNKTYIDAQKQTFNYIKLKMNGIKNTATNNKSIKIKIVQKG